MINKKSWKEFQEAGLLWWINRILHTFGWAIVFVCDETTGEVESVYPARVKFRGFTTDVEEVGFTNLSKYMRENAEKLLEEVME